MLQLITALLACLSPYSFAFATEASPKADSPDSYYMEASGACEDGDVGSVQARILRGFHVSGVWGCDGPANLQRYYSYAFVEANRPEENEILAGRIRQLREYPFKVSFSARRILKFVSAPQIKLCENVTDHFCRPGSVEVRVITPEREFDSMYVGPRALNGTCLPAGNPTTITEFRRLLLPVFGPSGSLDVLAGATQSRPYLGLEWLCGPIALRLEGGDTVTPWTSSGAITFDCRKVGATSCYELF